MHAYMTSDSHAACIAIYVVSDVAVRAVKKGVQASYMDGFGHALFQVMEQVIGAHCLATAHTRPRFLTAFVTCSFSRAYLPYGFNAKSCFLPKFLRTLVKPAPCLHAHEA